MDGTFPYRPVYTIKIYLLLSLFVSYIAKHNAMNISKAMTPINAINHISVNF